MAGYRTVLFDLDGTLLDTAAMIITSLRHALALHLDYDPGDALLLAGIGTTLHDQLREHAIRARSRSVDEALVRGLAETYIEHNHGIHDALVGAFPGVVEVLDHLRGAGVRLGIVTSKGKAIAERGLDLCGLRAHFEVVITAEDVERHKPHPEPVHTALRALGVSAAHALFVGDSPHDVNAGNAAGVATGAALWGPFPRDVLRPSGPTHWLDRVGDVLKLL